MKLINFGLKLEQLRDFVQNNVSFPVYVGKPTIVPEGTYGYLRLEHNSEEIKNDNRGTYAKNAIVDFIIASGSSSTPDMELYELMNEVSTLFVFKEVVISDDFKIYRVDEMAQSGVMRDVNQNPMIIGEYSFTYKYCYE